VEWWATLFVANVCVRGRGGMLTYPFPNPHTTTAVITAVFYGGYAKVTMWLNTSLHLTVGHLVLAAKIAK